MLCEQLGKQPKKIHCINIFDYLLHRENGLVKCYAECKVDHIIPLSKFDLTERKQIKKACHWFNLGPLWDVENKSKGAKLL